MFSSTLSSMDGFKLTTKDGEEIIINLIRTAGVNMATISIDCEDSTVIEKIESTVPVLERVKSDLIKEIDRLTLEYNRHNRNKVVHRKRRDYPKQPANNETKKFPSEDSRGRYPFTRD